MSITSAFRHFATEWQAARAEARTQRIIGSLPLEVQKDIGWPDVHRTRNYPLGLGSWAGDK